METIILDAAAMTDRAAAHAHLAERLGLPDWYGRNLDALYDLLSAREGEVRLVLENAPLLPEALGPYGAALLGTLEDAARANPGLSVEA